MSSRDLHPLLRHRRSSRTFDPAHELGEEDLMVLLEAARWAPSAGNSQPWAFLLARRGEPAHDRMVARLSRGTAAWAPAAAALVLTLHRSGTTRTLRWRSPTTPSTTSARRWPTSPCRPRRSGCRCTSSPGSTTTASRPSSRSRRPGA